MSTAVVDVVAPLAAVFDLNTRLFLNTLDGLEDVEATVRPNRYTNSIAFIGGHVVEARAWMGRLLGLDTPAPFGGALEHRTSIDTITSFPTLLEIRAAWQATSDQVSARLGTITDAELAGASGERFPGVPATLLGAIAFLVQHESYHIGQLAFVRKYLGRPSMSYR